MGLDTSSSPGGGGGRPSTLWLPPGRRRQRRSSSSSSSSSSANLLMQQRQQQQQQCTALFRPPPSSGLTVRSVAEDEWLAWRHHLSNGSIESAVLAVRSDDDGDGAVLEDEARHPIAFVRTVLHTVLY